MASPSLRVLELPMRDARFPSMASIFCKDIADTSLRVQVVRDPPNIWSGTYVEEGLSSGMKITHS